MFWNKNYKINTHQYKKGNEDKMETKLTKLESLIDTKKKLLVK